MRKLLFILVAIAAASDYARSCRHEIQEICNHEKWPKEPPGNEEELEEFCDFVVPYFECSVSNLHLCENEDEDYSNYVEMTRDVSANTVRICDKDSLLFKALADSLPCLKGNLQLSHGCHGFGDETDVEKFTEYLSSQGVTDLGENEEDVFDCKHNLFSFSCFSVRINETCGEIAKDVFLEMILGFATPFKSCPPEIKDQLPAIASAFKLEEEKEEELENALK